MSTIRPAFDQFPKEGAIIGRLLAGYGELELSLCFCVSAIRDDFNMTFKAMFRPRGESQRIDIADAIGREPYHILNLGTVFEEAIANMRYCLKIRNQFAHCYWTDDFGRKLGFVQLEETAKQHAPVSDVWHIPAHDVGLSLLESQEEFFFHTHNAFWYLNYEVSVRAGKSSKNPRPVPQKVARPPLYNP